MRIVCDTVNLESRIFSAANPGEILVPKIFYEGLKNDFPFKKFRANSS